MNRPQRHLKFATSFVVALAFLFIASHASALDGYKDRRGIFAGVGLGGGLGTVSVDSVEEVTGLEDREVGLAMRLELGGGATEYLTVSGQFNWWLRSVENNGRSLSHNHTNFLGNVAFFPIDFLYINAGVGMAYSSFKTEVNRVSIREYSEIGFAMKGGIGAEFWVNGTIAAGIEGSYTRHFYSETDFDTITAGLTVRWY